MVVLQDGTRKQRHVPVYVKPRPCNKCGAPIGFIQLKSGAWQPMDVQKDAEGYFIMTNRGNYGNYNPRHRCSIGVETRRAPPTDESAGIRTEDRL